MKKILSAAAFMAALGLMICGCSSKVSTSTSDHKEVTTSQPFTERVVESAEGSYIFDKASLLSPEDAKACNDYAGWLYKEKIINIAVITVGDLGGKTPYDYAADAFGDIYEGKGSGLVLLINNDTNVDVVYKTGSCLANIGEKAQENAVYWATKEIIGGDYRKGIMRLLQLGELCPTRVIDNAEIFEYEQIDTLEQELSSLKEDVTLLATENRSSGSNEEILKTYYKRKYKDGQGIMLMIDKKSKTIIAYSDEELPKELVSALKTANEFTAKDDNYSAVSKIIEAMGGKNVKEKTE